MVTATEFFFSAPITKKNYMSAPTWKQLMKVHLFFSWIGEHSYFFGKSLQVRRLFSEHSARSSNKMGSIIFFKFFSCSYFGMASIASFFLFFFSLFKGSGPYIFLSIFFLLVIWNGKHCFHVLLFSYFFSFEKLKIMLHHPCSPF